MSADVAAERFFRVLYGDDPPGYLALWRYATKKTTWVRATDVAAAGKTVVGQADVYFGMGLHPKDLGEGERGTSEDVNAIPGLWFDVDVKGPAHKEECLPPTFDEALALVSEFPLAPSVLINSGHGIHAHWLFQELWTFDTDDERRKAEALVEAFQATLQVKARTHGWEIEATHDLARVLRPPGSINKKLDPVAVTIRDLHVERRYNPSDFEEWLIEWPPPTVNPSPDLNGSATEKTRLPLGYDALGFVANGAPIGQQRTRAVAATRNYLSAGFSVEDTAKALWRGFQASRQDADREPWTYADALAITKDLARSPAKPRRDISSYPAPFSSSRNGAHSNGRVHAPPAALLASTVTTFRRWLHFPDARPIYVPLGTIAANRMEGDPVWLMTVGASSGGKTEILYAMSRLADVHLAATLTEASLLSGTPKREKDAAAKGGLLREIGPFGILLVKDFTSILSMPRDPRAALLAALREIFDGRWTRHIGVDGGRTLSWEGKIGLLAGCTTVIDNHHAVISSMGERFLMYRLGDIAPEPQARQALANTGREREMRAELCQAVATLFDGLDLPAVPPPLDANETTGLIALATLAARARSAVDRDSYTREVELIPDAEAPARIAQTLRRLYGGLQAIGLDRHTAWLYVEKVGLDCMPKLRRQVFDEVLSATSWSTTTEIATRIGYPTVTTRRALEDLSIHGLVERGSGDPGKADKWQASAWTRQQHAQLKTLSEMLVKECSSLNTLNTVYDDLSDKVLR